MGELSEKALVGGMIFRSINTKLGYLINDFGNPFDNYSVVLMHVQRSDC